MVSSQSGVSDSPKPGCSGAITSNFAASVFMNGIQAAPLASWRTTSARPDPLRIRRMLQPRIVILEVTDSAMERVLVDAGVAVGRGAFNAHPGSKSIAPPTNYR